MLFVWAAVLGLIDVFPGIHVETFRYVLYTPMLIVIAFVEVVGTP